MFFLWRQNRRISGLVLAAWALVVSMAPVVFAKEIMNNNVSMRQGPGAYYKVVEVMNAGDQVAVVEEGGAWIRVDSASEKTGWIPARALAPTKNLIDYGAMSRQWTSRTTSRTMVSAAVKGFFESKSKDPRINSEFLDRPFKKYFNPEQYLQFREETYGKGGDPILSEGADRPGPGKDYQIDERFLATSAYLVARLTAPGLSDDLKVVEYVNKVAQLIAEKTEYYDLPVCVHVVKTEEIFCNATPIGVLVISQGFLKVVESEHELACLLGHELAHVTLQHGSLELEKRKTRLKAQDSFAELDRISGMDTEDLDELAHEMFERAIRGRKEEYEAEADARGMIYAGRAGYDVTAMITLMERLQASIPRSRDPEDRSHWMPFSLENRILGLQGSTTKKACPKTRHARCEGRFSTIMSSP